MKKLFLITLLVSGIVFTVDAQAIRYGISCGVTYPEFSYKSNFLSNVSGVSKHQIPSFSINANAELPLSHHLVLRTEIGYFRYGFKLNYTQQNYYYPLMISYPQYFSGLSLYKFNNIKIATYLKYQPFKISHVYILAGPQLAFMFDAATQHRWYYTDTGKLRSEQNESLNPSMHHYNLSFNAGIGYEFHFFKSLTPYIEATYSLGLTNLSKSGHTQQFFPFTTQNAWRQSGIELIMGISI